MAIKRTEADTNGEVTTCDLLEIDEMSSAGVRIGVERAESRVDVSDPNEGRGEPEETASPVKEQIDHAANGEADQTGTGALWG